MKKILLFLLTFSALHTWAQVKSPSEYLPYYGKEISYYHQVEDYFKYLSSETPYLKTQKYGETNEHRNLNVYFISTPENLNQLEAIRLSNLAAIGMAPNSSKIIDHKLIVWLSFNVHGNEWAGTETALTVAYELCNPENKTSKEWLQNTIVILDPCVNPDGYSRYGNWLHEISGKNTQPENTDREHAEDWPGGRYNHYLFDLNRDWAWQTQVESTQRLALYNQWMPQVHTDVHEQGYNTPYFFPPSTEPIHEFIAGFQKDFYALLGKNISAKFDAQNWMYNTSERFDLFYPSYGDTYPCYNGAVGLTIEQGGIGGGRAVNIENGGILTIKDRIAHHATAVLTIVASAASQIDPLLQGFRAYMNDSRKNMKGTYATYVLKSNPKLEQLADLLRKNKIEFAYADGKMSASGYDYYTQKEHSFTIEPKDMIVKANQQKSVLAQIFFEPEQKFHDSLSYDITAWTLPLAYGVQAYALKNTIALATKTSLSPTASPAIPQNVYAFQVPWNNRTSVQILSLLLQKNIKVRFALKEAIFEQSTVQAGGLVITKADNPNVENFERVMTEIVKNKSDFSILNSGYSKNARDIGGENFRLIRAPKVMLLSGNGVSATEFGFVWFYMDQFLNYPVSIVNINRFQVSRLSNFNTLILADGKYQFTAEEHKKIADWVSSGGKLILMGGALKTFEDKEGYALNPFASEEEKQNAAKKTSEQEAENRFLDYGNEERRKLSSTIPGALIENKVDESHPLSFGLGKPYFSLKTNELRYSLLNKAANVLYVPQNFKSYGFVGAQIAKSIPESVSFAVENKGAGKVIYMVDNPLFRAFWENGNILFSNALFLVN